jgi:hypothetical protein
MADGGEQFGFGLVGGFCGLTRLTRRCEAVDETLDLGIQVVRVGALSLHPD